MGGARREMSGIIYLFSEFWSCCADVDSLAQNRPWPHRWHVPSDECWGKGRARGAINKIVWGGVNIMAAAEKRLKYRRTMFWVTHDILLKLHPGQKLGDAVARASVVPVRPIQHEGIKH